MGINHADTAEFRFTPGW